MKSSDRTILMAVLVLGVLASFWFFVLSPKRAEVSKLDEEITSLQGALSEQEQLAAAAHQAKTGYEENYHRLVVLGKAVPGDEDAATLIEQTQALANRAGLDFRGIKLAESSGEAAPPPAATQTTADGSAEGASAPPATPTAAPATEAAAATLPIGATVGAAGLPVMPYDLSFRGDFFEIADFMAELDSLVRTDAKGVGVDGRLLTVDGFVFTPDVVDGFPMLNANLHVTTYVAPADQGATAGATAAAPAPTSVTGAPAPTTPTPAATAAPAP